MAFEGFTSLDSDAAVGNTWTDGGVITATPAEVINVMISVDNQSGTITDDAQVRVLVARDDTPTDYVDEAPIFETSKTPATVGLEWLFAFSLAGYKHYKIQWQSSGATDTYDFAGEYRGDGVSL